MGLPIWLAAVLSRSRGSFLWWTVLQCVIYSSIMCMSNLHYRMSIQYNHRDSSLSSDKWHKYVWNTYLLADALQLILRNTIGMQQSSCLYQPFVWLALLRLLFINQQSVFGQHRVQCWCWWWCWYSPLRSCARLANFSSKKFMTSSLSSGSWQSFGKMVSFIHTQCSVISFVVAAVAMTNGLGSYNT